MPRLASLERILISDEVAALRLVAGEDQFVCIWALGYTYRYLHIKKSHIYGKHVGLGQYMDEPKPTSNHCMGLLIRCWH